MNMQELADKLYDKIFEVISRVIDPYVENKRDWATIERAIHNWFDRNGVLNYCISHAKHLHNRGNIFYDMSGIMISIEKVVAKLREVKIDQEILKDILNHYGNKVPETIFLEKCNGDEEPYIKVRRDGRIVGRGCGVLPKKDNRSI